MKLEEIAASVLLGIAVMVVIGRLLGAVFSRIRQPVVVAEILAGLALGPSLLGTLPGNPTEWLFPQEARPFLYVVATLGLVIFMFVVGLELDLDLVRGKGRVAVTVSVTSVVVPFVSGAGLGLWLYEEHSANGVDRLAFVLFIGAAMSVTAFPVLARILSERGMHRTPTGVLALACAAVDDILAWIILAAVLAVARSSGTADLVVMVAESLVFVVVMFFVVRPRLRSLVARRDAHGGLTPDIFAVVLVGALLSSYLTDKIGIHAIFGAFLFGAIMPRQGAAALRHEILERVEQMTVLLLLPVFFIYTGLNTNIAGLDSQGFVELLAVLAVACAGKFLGASLAARASGVRPRRAAALGVLMNTRGLTELVILNVGREAGVLDEELFTVLVVMAVFTTVITEPILRFVYPDRLVAREVAQAERAALGTAAGYRVVAVLPDEGGEGPVDTAVALLDRRVAAQLVMARFDPAGRKLELGAGLGLSLEGLASSFESLQLLEQRAGASGADVVVQSRVSEDVGRDAAGLVTAADADVVVVGRADDELVGQLLAGLDCVVVWSPEGGPAGWLGTGGPEPVVVQVGSSDDATAAVEQALRLAARTGSPLVLFPGDDRRDHRAAVALQRQIAGTGLDVRVADAGEAIPAAAVRVVGHQERTAGRSRLEGSGAGVLVVRGGRADAAESLTAWLRGPAA